MRACGSASRGLPLRCSDIPSGSAPESSVHATGGFAFAAARLGVAAWPWLALRINGKKGAPPIFVFGSMSPGEMKGPVRKLAESNSVAITVAGSALWLAVAGASVLSRANHPPNPTRRALNRTRTSVSARCIRNGGRE